MGIAAGPRIRLDVMLTNSSLVILAGAFLSLTSCTTTTQLKGKNEDMVFPVLRGHVNFTDEASSPRRGRGVAGLELALSAGSGDFEPSGGSFSNADFELIDTHVAFIGGAELEGWIRIEGLAGIQLNNFEMTVDQAGQPRSNDVSNGIGPMVGAQLSFEVVDDRLSLYGRGTTSEGYGDITTENLEAGFKIDVSPSIRLLLAYRWWEYEGDGLRFGPTRVDLDLELRGLVIGMEARFQPAP